MGREIRRVPPDWQHPKNDDGQYQPLHDACYREAAADYGEFARAWANRDVPAIQATDVGRLVTEGTLTEYDWPWEYAVTPDTDYYRDRCWDAEEATHFQVYENVSEGTPISPVLPTLDAVAAWLVVQGFCERGYAVSFVISEGRMRDGISALGS